MEAREGNQCRELLNRKLNVRPKSRGTADPKRDNVYDRRADRTRPEEKINI